MSTRKTSRNETLQKIKKLLNHAESAREIDSEAEALAFQQKAEELMAQHKISSAEVAGVELDEQDPIIRRRLDPSDYDDRDIRRTRERRGWEQILGSAVADAHYCQQIITTGSNVRWFVGRETDTEIAEYVFFRLVKFAQAEATREYGRQRRAAKKAGEPFNGNGFKTSFRMAFAHTVANRYAKMEREREERLEDEGKSTALVHLRDEKEKVREWMDKNLDLRSGKGTSARASNLQGAVAGQRAGRNVDLNANGVGGSDQGRLTS